METFLSHVQRVLENNKGSSFLETVRQEFEVALKKVVMLESSLLLEPLVFTSRSCHAQVRLMDSASAHRSREGRKIIESLRELDEHLEVSFSRDGVDIPVYSADHSEYRWAL